MAFALAAEDIEVFTDVVFFDGSHTLRVTVPDAQFVNAQGDFPLSVYLTATL